MKNPNLAADYVKRCDARLKALETLMKEKSYADVVRESQEVVELALKAFLRNFGIEAPRVHDVSAILLEHQERFPDAAQQKIAWLAAVSKNLRRDREISFYGSEDLTPSEFYNVEDATKALKDAREVVQIVKTHMPN